MRNRHPDADIWYLLLRARSLEPFVARSDEERALLVEIRDRFGGAGSPGRPEKPIGKLERLTDTDSNVVHSAITAQVAPLKEAYSRGMAVARTAEQREVLTDLRRLSGPPRDS